MMCRWYNSCESVTMFRHRYRAHLLVALRLQLSKSPAIRSIKVNGCRERKCAHCERVAQKRTASSSCTIRRRLTLLTVFTKHVFRFSNSENLKLDLHIFINPPLSQLAHLNANQLPCRLRCLIAAFNKHIKRGCWLFAHRSPTGSRINML